jgi:hypothetical protein
MHTSVKNRTLYPTEEQDHHIASIDWCSAAISRQTGNADMIVVVVLGVKGLPL